MNHADFQAVRSRLTTIKAQFDDLINELQKDSPDRLWVKTKYGALKVKLRHDADSFKTKKGQTQASDSESAFYYPAVTEACLELTVKIDAPPNEKMLHCLMSGEEQIAYYLSRMNT